MTSKNLMKGIYCIKSFENLTDYSWGTKRSVMMSKLSCKLHVYHLLWLIWLLVIFLFFFRMSRIILELREDDCNSSDSGSSDIESDFEQDRTLDLSSAPTDNEYVNYY